MISTLLPDDNIDISQLYFNWAMRERLRDKLHYFLLTLTQPRDRHFYSFNVPDRKYKIAGKMRHQIFACYISAG